MLNRLDELRSAAQPPQAEGDEGEEEEGPGVIGSLSGYFRNDKEKQDKERKEMEKQFEEMMKAEQAVFMKCRDFHACLKKLRDTRALERKAVLPEKLSQLENKLDSEEQACQRLVKTVKTLLDELRDNPVPGEPPEKAEQRATPLFQAFSRVRANWAQFHRKDYDAVVSEFFHLRSELRQEQIVHTRRRLRFAYPQAHESTIEEALIYPQLAKMAIERRMECGEAEEPPALEDVFDELAETKYSKEIRLAEETRELKLLFVQFAELVEQQGEALSAVEANIQGTLEQMQEAVEHLEAAVDFKKEAQRLAAWRKFMLRMSLFASGFFVLWMSGEPAWTTLLGCLQLEHLLAEEASFVAGELHHQEQLLAEATSIDTEASHLQLAAQVRRLPRSKRGDRGHRKKADMAKSSVDVRADLAARRHEDASSPQRRLLQQTARPEVLAHKMPLPLHRRTVQNAAEMNAPPLRDAAKAVVESGRAAQRSRPLRRVQAKLATSRDPSNFTKQASAAVQLTAKGASLPKTVKETAP